MENVALKPLVAFCCLLSRNLPNSTTNSRNMELNIIIRYLIRYLIKNSSIDKHSYIVFCLFNMYIVTTKQEEMARNVDDNNC